MTSAETTDKSTLNKILDNPDPVAAIKKKWTKLTLDQKIIAIAIVAIGTPYFLGVSPIVYKDGKNIVICAQQERLATKERGASFEDGRESTALVAMGDSSRLHKTNPEKGLESCFRILAIMNENRFSKKELAEIVNKEYYLHLDNHPTILIDNIQPANPPDKKSGLKSALLFAGAAVVPVAGIAAGIVFPAIPAFALLLGTFTTSGALAVAGAQASDPPINLANGYRGFS